ncbi:hypothetical protein HGA64_00180 [Candidatus Falkowbacteria bacterium]|nr:hypothetical protein [Candidatus Falkowbacteria bacterium]
MFHENPYPEALAGPQKIEEGMNEILEQEIRQRLMSGSGKEKGPIPYSTLDSFRESGAEVGMFDLVMIQKAIKHRLKIEEATVEALEIDRWVGPALYEFCQKNGIKCFEAVKFVDPALNEVAGEVKWDNKIGDGATAGHSKKNHKKYQYIPQKVFIEESLQDDNNNRIENRQNDDSNGDDKLNI